MLELPEGSFGIPGFPRSEKVKLIGIEIIEDEENCRSDLFIFTVMKAKKM
jgi:hypothetical protein